MGRASPKSKEDELFGSRTPAGKPKSGGNLDDIFGKRRSPTDQDLFSGKKTPKESEQGRKTPTNGRQSPKGTDPFGRKTPTQKDDSFSRRTPTQREDATGRMTPTQKDSFGRKSPGQKEDPFGRKTTTNSGPSLDDIFGGKKRAESPLFKSKQRGAEEAAPERAGTGARKGSYMASLLADSDEERDDREAKPKTRTSYMDSLLGDEKGEHKVS